MDLNLKELCKRFSSSGSSSADPPKTKSARLGDSPKSKLQKLIFQDTSMMNGIIDYLKKLNSINKNVMTCLLRRLVEEKKDDGFEIVGRMFWGLKLSDDEFDVKITVPNSKRKEHWDTDLTCEPNFNDIVKLDGFKKLRKELIKEALPNNIEEREAELIKLVRDAFKLDQDQERFFSTTINSGQKMYSKYGGSELADEGHQLDYLKHGMGSKLTEWDCFWQEDVGRSHDFTEYELTQLKDFCADAFCWAIAHVIKDHL